MRGSLLSFLLAVLLLGGRSVPFSTFGGAECVCAATSSCCISDSEMSCCEEETDTTRMMRSCSCDQHDAPVADTSGGWTFVGVPAATTTSVRPGGKIADLGATLVVAWASVPDPPPPRAS